MKIVPDGSEVTDDEGNTYGGPSELSFAKGNENFHYLIELALKEGVMTKCRMKIKNVDPAASMIKYAKIERCLEFLNVPITREGDVE